MQGYTSSQKCSNNAWLLLSAVIINLEEVLRVLMTGEAICRGSRQNRVRNCRVIDCDRACEGEKVDLPP